MKQKISEMRILTFLFKCFSSIEDNSEMNNGDLDTQTVQPEYKIERDLIKMAESSPNDSNAFPFISWEQAHLKIERIISIIHIFNAGEAAVERPNFPVGKFDCRTGTQRQRRFRTTRIGSSKTSEPN